MLSSFDDKSSLDRVVRISESKDGSRRKTTSKRILKSARSLKSVKGAKSRSSLKSRESNRTISRNKHVQSDRKSSPSKSYSRGVNQPMFGRSSRNSEISFKTNEKNDGTFGQNTCSKHSMLEAEIRSK
jgi:hypothetical protein